MARGNPGRLVLTAKGKKGIVYNNEDLVGTKIAVHLVNQKFEKTGKKLLCSSDSLTVIGMVD